MSDKNTYRKKRIPTYTQNNSSPFFWKRYILFFAGEGGECSEKTIMFFSKRRKTKVIKLFCDHFFNFEKLFSKKKNCFWLYEKQFSSIFFSSERKKWTCNIDLIWKHNESFAPLKQNGVPWWHCAMNHVHKFP